MRKSAILIDMYNSALTIRQNYSEYFSEEMSEYELAFHIGALVEYLITNYIDSLTKHPAKLVDSNTRSLMEQKYPFINHILDEIDRDIFIFPWIETLTEFMSEDEYNIYTYERNSFTIIVIKNDDWRAMEYEKMQLEKLSSQQDICLDEWTDKPELVERYLNSLRTPRK